MNQTGDSGARPKLPHERILALHKAALACGFTDDAAHFMLLAGLPPAYVAGLPASGAPSARLMLVLNRLNHDGRLRDGTDPLEIWLVNAAQAAGMLTSGIVFELALGVLRECPQDSPTPTPSLTVASRPDPPAQGSATLRSTVSTENALVSDAEADALPESEGAPEASASAARPPGSAGSGALRSPTGRRVGWVAFGIVGALGLMAVLGKRAWRPEGRETDSAPVLPSASTSVPRGGAPLGEVLIAGGSFVIGSDSAEGSDDGRNGPLVTVKSFWLDSTEVTVRHYRRCMGTSKCTPPGSGPACNMDLFGREAHPVNCVTHVQAVAYCQLVQKRLPTEAEWEWAARGARPAPVLPAGPCGDQGKTSEVGTLGDAVGGVFDLRGNVREWTADRYVEHGQGSITSPSRRVVRGAAWNTHVKQDCRITARSHREPSHYDEGLGFRCARDR